MFPHNGKEFCGGLRRARDHKSANSCSVRTDMDGFRVESVAKWTTFQSLMIVVRFYTLVTKCVFASQRVDRDPQQTQTAARNSTAKGSHESHVLLHYGSFTKPVSLHGLNEVMPQGCHGHVVVVDNCT